MPLSWLLSFLACSPAAGPGSDGVDGTGGERDSGSATDTGAAGDSGATGAEGCPDELPIGPDWSATGSHEVGTRVHEAELDYGGTMLPFHVLVYYPASSSGPDAAPVAGPHPVMIFEHAYGAAPDQYDWLFRTLASRGWVIAAPEHDAGEWNSVDGGYWESHAFLAAETLDLLDDWQAVPDDGWADMIDPDRLVLGGHSHGAGSVLRLAQRLPPMTASGARDVDAIVFLSGKPDRGEAYDDYPTWYQGMPPFLHLTGGADHGSDIAFGQTLATYDQHGRPGGFVYVDGADHYSWTDDADDGYATIERQAVHDVALPAVVSFLAAAVEADRDGAAAWRGDAVAAWRGGTVLREQWHDTDVVGIDDFEPADRTAWTAEGFAVAEEVWAIDEERALYSTSWALELAWSGVGAWVRWTFDPVDVAEHPVLSMRLLAVHDDPANPSDQPLDLDVEIVDADGTVVAWSLSDAPQGALLPTPWWLPGTTPKSVFATWRVPVRRLAELVPALDLESIVEVRLVTTEASGRILVDDLEWSAGEGCW